MDKFDAKKIISDKFAVFFNIAMFKHLFICISLRDKQARKQDLSQPNILKHLNAKNMLNITFPQ